MQTYSRKERKKITSRKLDVYKPDLSVQAVPAALPDPVALADPEDPAVLLVPLRLAVPFLPAHVDLLDLAALAIRDGPEYLSYLGQPHPSIHVFLADLAFLADPVDQPDLALISQQYGQPLS